MRSRNLFLYSILLILLIGSVSSLNYTINLLEDFENCNTSCALNYSVFTPSRYGPGVKAEVIERVPGDKEFKIKTNIDGDDILWWESRLWYDVALGQVKNTSFSSEMITTILDNNERTKAAGTGINLVFGSNKKDKRGNYLYYTVFLAQQQIDPHHHNGIFNKNCLMFRTSEGFPDNTRIDKFYYIYDNNGKFKTMYAGEAYFHNSYTIDPGDISFTPGSPEVPLGAICKTPGQPLDDYVYRVLLNYNSEKHEVTAFIQQKNKTTGDVLKESFTNETFEIPGHFKNSMWARQSADSNRRGQVEVYFDNIELKYGPYTPIYPKNCSSLNQTIFKIASESNAHAELYNQNNYPLSICYDEIFGEVYTGTNPHSCTSENANKVLGLNSSTNARAQIPSLTTYSNNVCYGDLICRSVQGKEDCKTNEKCVITLSSNTSARVAICTSPNPYDIKICCKSPSLNPVNTDSCNLTSASWNTTSAYEGDEVQLNLEGTNCNDQNVTFIICETDSVYPFPLSCDERDTAKLNTSKLTATFSGNSATTTWNAEWIKDENNGPFGDDNPEFFFTATLSEDETKYKISEKLTVTRLCGNKVLNIGEQCDGVENCNDDCTCIEGFVPGIGNSCILLNEGDTYCGDGVVQNPNDQGVEEECDEGFNNGFTGSGCSLDCKILISETGCAQYTTPEDCEKYDPNVAKKDIKETRDDGKTCEEIFGKTAPPASCDKKLVDCRCVWEDNKCKAKNDINLINCSGEDPDNPYGTCTYDRRSEGDCNVPGTKFISFITEGVFAWEGGSGDDNSRTQDELEKAYCETIPDESFPCPSTTKLPFFTAWNFIITLLGITLIYGYLILRKNSK